MCHIFIFLNILTRIIAAPSPDADPQAMDLIVQVHQQVGGYGGCGIGGCLKDNGDPKENGDPNENGEPKENVPPTNAATTTTETTEQLTEGPDCPLADGFFLLPGRHKCFKSIREVMNWAAADSKCKSEGLALARPEPQDALALRKYLIETYGDWSHWLSGKADGQYWTWTGGDQERLSATSPLWYPGHGSRVSTDLCLLFLTQNSYLESHPKQPYYSGRCSWTKYPLCELIME